MTDRHGIVSESGAVRFQRLLPAPPERVWDYLTDSALRRTWFAAGDMELKPGGALTFVFRNSELSHHGEEVPEKFRQYEGLETDGKIIEVDPPRRLLHIWGEEEVEWLLEPRGDGTLLTLTHSRLKDRAMKVDVSSGWHIHLDMLEDLLAGRTPRPFWSTQAVYEQDYEERVPKE
jgi:uncharacterized protein YndB with AHSA1/START domain